MRITPHEAQVIRTAITAHDPNAIIFLFGSRTDDNKKGGDIDLLVESKVIGLPQKLDILVSIKDKIGDQKIDLIISENIELTADPFIRSIKRKAIKL